MKIIKWGIIGTGSIAAAFAAALNSMDNTEILAVASREKSRAEDFAGRFHINKAYGSYEELAKNPEIDVIYIATPHTEHKDNAALCMKNKKAVLCEKPITLNQKETSYLISLANEHGVFLMEAMWTKFLPATNKVKEWIQSRAIGNIKYMKISFGFRNEFDIQSRLYNPDLAGGALLDVGIYPVTYSVFLMNKLPDQVVSSACIGKSNVDEVNVIVFRFEDGVMADLSSAIAAETGFDAVIIGDKGKIIVPNFWMAENAYRYDNKGDLAETFSMKFKENGYEYEAEEVNRCLREGRLESDKVPLRDTLDIMKVMDGIREQWGLSYPQELWER